MIVAIYARVSTKDKGQDPATQLGPLREWVAARGWECREYVDNGISGAKESRPALDELMRDARRRRIAAVLVARFDRFARSTRHLVTALEEFRALGIDFISLTESIDTSTPMGKMVFTVISAVAELERSLIAERVKAGIDRARRAGKRLGRPKIPGSLRRQVITLRESGTSYREIARLTGLSKSAAYKIMMEIP